MFAEPTINPERKSMPTETSLVTLCDYDYLKTEEYKPLAHQHVENVSSAASLWECDTVWWR